MGRRSSRRIDDSDEESETSSESSVGDGGEEVLELEKGGFPDKEAAAALAAGPSGGGGSGGGDANNNNVVADTGCNDVDEESNAVSNPEWKWPRYKSCFYRGERHTEALSSKAEEEEVKGEKTPFKVTYLERYPKEPKVTVTLYSSVLTQLAKRILPHSKAVFSQQLAVSGRDLFLVRDAIREAAAAASTSDSGDSEQQGQQQGPSSAAAAPAADHEEVRRRHARHLLRIEEEEYRDTITRHAQMERSGTVSWDMLWTFLVPGELARFKCDMSAQAMCGRVESGRYRTSFRGAPTSRSRCRCSTTTCTATASARWRSRCARTSTRWRSGPSGWRWRRCGCCRRRSGRPCSRRGRTRAPPSSTASSRGPSASPSSRATWPWRTRRPGTTPSSSTAPTGMLDLWFFSRMNPDYELGTARPPAEELRGGGGGRAGANRAPPERPPPEHLLLGPAVAYGFSFAVKKWGCFDVSGMRDIVFDDDAFDDLVRWLVV